MTTGAARSGLRTAEDALSAARGARALLDDQLLDAPRATRNAEAAVRSAALRVLAAEELETQITAAVVACRLRRGSALWRGSSATTPESGDDRARQLVAGADTRPAALPEAAFSGR